MFLQEIYELTDYIKYDTTSYQNIDITSWNINLPSSWQLEFDLHPTNRSTASGGQSHYIKTKNSNNNQEYWLGQGTSGGSHGIMIRPSTNQWCASYTNTGVDNHVVVTYENGVLTYTCNSESVSVSASNIDVLTGIFVAPLPVLKNIKVKAL